MFVVKMSNLAVLFKFTKDILKKTLRFALWIARNFIKVKTEAIKSK